MEAIYRDKVYDIKIIENGKRDTDDAAYTYMDKYGPHFTDALAEFASGLMQNVSGTKHSWTAQQIKKAVAANAAILHYEAGALPNNATYGDITYLANMAYADLYPEVLSDELSCIKYALAVIKDPDGYEGSVFYKWLMDAEKKEIRVEWKKFV